MSFSGEVKEELAKHAGSARHCQIAEMAAILLYCGTIKQQGGKWSVVLETENALAAQKALLLYKKIFHIDAVMTERASGRRGKSAVTAVVLANPQETENVLQTMKFLGIDGSLHIEGKRLDGLLGKSRCCQRAILRGAYLAIGSMSDPGKSYHLELVCDYEGQACQLRDIISGFGIEARIIRRKKYYVVYIKEGSGIVDFLNLAEAHVSLMNFENLRIWKEMKNSVNRRVNCETANITRTVAAAARQLEDIMFLRDTCGLNILPDHLHEMAEVRLKYPDAPLKELGQYLDPPVGKSGVNHRLRQLGEFAQQKQAENWKKRETPAK